MENDDGQTIERIMDAEKWLSISLPDNLELLNEIADNFFEKDAFDGMLGATLMYHQIIEAMCIHLLENCYFQIQLSVYPATIDFKVPSEKMLGFYINELKSSISFYEKDTFLKMVQDFNSIRISIVHKMRKTNLDLLIEEVKPIKTLFDEIYEKYDSIQDDFRVAFHSYKKDTFIDYLNDGEYEQVFGIT